MHDLDNALTFAQSVLIKSHLISLFAKKKKTGTIAYSWQFLLKLLLSCLNKCMLHVLISGAPHSFNKLPKFVIDEACCMMFEEMIENKIDRAILSFPFVVPDIAQPRILLLFYLFLLINIRQHH